MPAKKVTFNLAQLDTIAACNKPVEIEIKDVHGRRTGFFISVLGKDSDVYRRNLDELTDAKLAADALGNSEPQNIETARATNIKALVDVTVGWRLGDSKIVPLGDEELDCTPANVRKVYERLIPVRDQVAEAINKVANFIPAS